MAYSTGTRSHELLGRCGSRHIFPDGWTYENLPDKWYRLPRWDRVLLWLPSDQQQQQQQSLTLEQDPPVEWIHQQLDGAVLRSEGKLALQSPQGQPLTVTYKCDSRATTKMEDIGLVTLETDIGYWQHSPTYISPYDEALPEIPALLLTCKSFCETDNNHQLVTLVGDCGPVQQALQSACNKTDLLFLTPNHTDLRRRLHRVLSEASRLSPAVVYIPPLFFALEEDHVSIDVHLPPAHTVYLPQVNRDVSSLITWLQYPTTKEMEHVVVVVASSSSVSLPPRLLQSAKLAITIPQPNEDIRLKYLTNWFRDHELKCEIPLEKLSRSCAGMSIKDLDAMCNTAWSKTCGRAKNIFQSPPTPQQMSPVDESIIGRMDFGIAWSKDDKHPWDAVVGLDVIKARLEKRVVRLLRPQAAERGLFPPKGVLFCGPAGVGKSMLAAALAHKISRTPIEVTLSDIAKGAVGESERCLTAIMERATRERPAAIIFDDIEAFFVHREDRDDWRSTLTSHFLGILDSLPSGVIVIGTTRDASALDSALLRSGRMDELVNLPLPSKEDRKSLLQDFQGIQWADDINLELLCDVTEDMSGASIRAFISQASIHSLIRHQERQDVPPTLSMVDIMAAVSRSITRSSSSPA